MAMRFGRLTLAGALARSWGTAKSLGGSSGLMGTLTKRQFFQGNLYSQPTASALVKLLEVKQRRGEI